MNLLHFLMGEKPGKSITLCHTSQHLSTGTIISHPTIFASIRLMLEYFAEHDGLKHVLSALLNWVFLLIYARVD